MKKIYSRSLKIYILLFVGVIGLLNGCKDDDDSLGSADRLFRPIISDSSKGSTWIKLEWNDYTDASYYHLDLSVDSFVTFEQQVDVDTNVYTFTNLEDEKSYYIRIKAVGDDIESEYYVNDIITTSSMTTNLNAVGPDDVIDTEARITWEEDTYDSIQVVRNDTLEQTVQVTDDENSDQEVILTDLTPERDYVVRAYDEGTYMGKKTFTTLEAENYGSNSVDLRNLSDDDAYEYLTQDFLDGLSDGETVILAPNVKYDIAGQVIGKSINFVGGYSLQGYPIFEVEGAFDVAADVSISKILFKRIKAIDHSNAKRTSSNYGGQYLMNMSNAGAAVDSLIINNCDIRYKRGVVRIKTGGITVSDITIKNSVLDSIGGYGVINPSTSNVTVDKIELSKSTFSHCNDFIVLAKTATLSALKVSYITTCYCPDANGYVFDLKTQEPDTISIKNSIFGPGLDTDSILGIRYSDVSTLTQSSNYQTSDCVFTSGELECSELDTDASSTFDDPDNNDYSVSSSSLINYAGDPRWW